MRSLTLLTFAATLAITSFSACANDSGTGGPGGGTAASHQTNPDPANPANQTPPAKPTARKEDEDDTSPKSKGFDLAGLKAYLPVSRKTAAAAVADSAARITALEAENKTLTDRIKAFENGSAVKALTEANNQMRSDLEAFALAAQQRGLLEDSTDATAPNAQSPAAKAVNAIINGAVAKEIRSVGHDPAKVAPKGAAASAADTSKLTPLQLISIGRSQQKQAQN